MGQRVSQGRIGLVPEQKKDVFFETIPEEDFERWVETAVTPRAFEAILDEVMADQMPMTRGRLVTLLHYSTAVQRRYPHISREIREIFKRNVQSREDVQTLYLGGEEKRRLWGT